MAHRSSTAQPTTDTVFAHIAYSDPALAAVAIYEERAETWGKRLGDLALGRALARWSLRSPEDQRRLARVLWVLEGIA